MCSGPLPQESRLLRREWGSRSKLCATCPIASAPAAASRVGYCLTPVKTPTSNIGAVMAVETCGRIIRTIPTCQRNQSRR